MADYINNRLRDADTDPNCPPYESVREYAYEGDGSTAGSLSSMGSRPQLSDDDWTEQFDRLGPPFDRFSDEWRTSLARDNIFYSPADDTWMNDVFINVW